jgi:hypothetical protein
MVEPGGGHRFERRQVQPFLAGEVGGARERQKNERQGCEVID